jgi:hypothetical protein
MTAPPLSPAQLAAGFDALLRAMPERKTLHFDNAANAEWLSEAAALAMMFDPVRAIGLRSEIDRLYGYAADPRSGVQRIILTVQQMKAECRMRSAGPMTIAFESGQQFDYFDEIRKILESATSDVLVIDPYLGADFISKYLPHIKGDVQIRLLVENQITQVRTTVEAYVAQYGANVEVRKSSGMHDRYIFIDKKECYHSGATFKDGAVKSPTTLTQITDAFAPVLQIYEEAWAAGKL